ncbi:hypothetical protein GCM10010389_01730 [Streptomyces echinoruber]|uniref:Uncharacterized protein n=2 Tax=Streptomyces echinoruber TaxID=68898 RepID=A0A918QSG4_9ACTN|nr:hypothetical protein GCM10010389_01730 [Streptomyces echinoruber]
MWLLACIGAGVILWLLTSAPDISSGYPQSECYSALGTEWTSAHGSMERSVEATCTSLQTRRLGWAVVVSVPTVVLASAAMRSRRA